jgi:hypothetical protein
MAIDLIPVLTETGGGTQMALDPGVSIHSTEKLAGTWCGDLLQIVDDLQENYKLVNCCFADMRSRADYCYHTFGANDDGYVLEDNYGNLFEVVTLDILGRRKQAKYMKVEQIGENVKFIPMSKNYITDSKFNNSKFKNN